ncbi:MAG: hypothetical protein ABSG83_00450 [Roseiarcus sp.]
MTRKPMIVLAVCAAALFSAALDWSAEARTAPGVHGPAPAPSAAAASPGVYQSNVCGDNCRRQPIHRAAQIYGHNCAIERRAAAEAGLYADAGFDPYRPTSDCRSDQ